MIHLVLLNTGPLILNQYNARVQIPAGGFARAQHLHILSIHCCTTTLHRLCSEQCTVVVCQLS